VPITPDGPISTTPLVPDGPISDAPPAPIQPDIKPDGPVSSTPIVPDGPIVSQTPNPIHTPHTFDAVINSVAGKTGLNPRIMQAIGMQESGLGAGANYNATTGRDKDSNAGVSPWQLDPASGISKDKLDRAAKDPAYAAELSANMMKQNMKATGGNLREALSMYNSGSRTSTQGLAYADSVLHFMGDDDAILHSPSLVEKVKHDAVALQHAVTHGTLSPKTFAGLQTTKPLHDLEVKGLEAWDEIRHHPVDATLNVLGTLQRGIGGTLHEISTLKPGDLDPEKMQQHLHNIWDMVFNPTPKNQEKSTAGLGEAVNKIAGRTIVPSHMQIDSWVRNGLHAPKVIQPYVDGVLEAGEDITEQTLTGGPGEIGRGLMHIGMQAPGLVARAAHGVAEAMGIAKHFDHLGLVSKAHTALADAFVARRDLDRAGLTEVGKKVRLAVENKHLNANPDDIHAATRDANREFEALSRAQPGKLHTGDPKALKKLGVQDNSDMFLAMRTFEKHNPLTKLAELGRKAILWNPIPHGLINVGTLSYMAGGIPAVISGFRHMIAPVEGVAERLSKMGGMQDYVDPTNNKFLKAGNDLLHRMEVGWRSGLLEQLDKKLGPSAPGSVEEYLKGHLISNRVGDYRNQSAFVKMFQALGGPFVAFGLGIVPQQFLKTLKEDPHRVYTMLQSMHDVQNDRQGKRRNTLEFENPMTAATKLFSDPVHYMSSPSRVGGIAELFDLKDEEDESKYKGLGQRAIDLAQAYIPGAEALGKAATAIGGKAMPGQKMSLADKLADVVEEEFMNMFYQKATKPKVLRAAKKKISKEVGI
jgi:Transglycosylase SLT domain